VAPGAVQTPAPLPHLEVALRLKSGRCALGSLSLELKEQSATLGEGGA
jgi:hypothetical protein